MAETNLKPQEQLQLEGVRLYWAKILGAPVDKYNPSDGKEWTVDIALDQNHIKELRSFGITTSFYVKESDNPEDDRGPYFTYRRSETYASGDQAKHIAVYDEYGDVWSKDKLLGNGTVANVNVIVRDVQAGRSSRGKPIITGIMITEHIPYEGGQEAEPAFKFKSKGSTEAPTEDWDE